MGKKLFSIILPIYGNEKNLPVTIPYIVEHLNLFPNYDVEIIMVCDGSPDNSWSVMKDMKQQYPDLIRIYKFDRNYYRQIAIAAGIEKAKGDVIGAISADMQDPIEVFVEMLAKWEAGYKLVAARRIKRSDPGIGWIFSNIWHRFLTHIDKRYPKGGFDLFLIDKSLKKGYCDKIVQNGYMPIVLLSLVAQPAYVDYERKAREIGKSGYTFGRKLHSVITISVIETDRLFYWLIFIGIVIGVLLVIIGILLSILMKPVILGLLTAVFGMLIGVTIAIMGLLGVSVYNWGVNLRNLPKYRIEDEIE